MTPQPPEVAALLARSNRLGSDPRNTNYAGGNTSVKAEADDPVTGRPVPLLWVKGSGGDLGTLTAGGLAVLRGSFAPNGAVVKVAGLDQSTTFEGTARVFASPAGAT